MSRKVWTRQPVTAADISRLGVTRGLIGLYGASQAGMLVNLARPKLRLTPSGSGASLRSTDRGVALALDGSSYFQDQSFSTATTAGRTMACWARLSALPGVEANVIVWTDAATVNSIEQLRINSSGTVTVESYRAGTAGVATTAGAVTVGQWHFIAAVMPSDASRTAWLDGESVTAATSAGTLGTDRWLTIGAAPWAGYTGTVTGEILLPMVWDRGLSQAEIAEVRRNSWALISPRNEPTFFLGPAAGGVTIDAAAGAASAAGIGAGVASPVTISAGAGQAAASGIGASVASPQTVAASTGAANAAGIDASVASPITIQAAAGSAAAAGRQAGVSSGASISAATGAASAIGISAGVASPITVASSVGAASGTGLGASVSSGNQIAATTGAASAAGLSASISSPQTVSAATGLASAAGLQAGVGTGTTIPAALGAASALGLTATVTAATHIVAAVGAAAAAGLGASVRNDGDAPSAPSSRRIAAASVLRSIVGPAANRRIQ